MKKQIFFSVATRFSSLLTQIAILFLVSKSFVKEELALWFLFSSLPFFISLLDIGLGGLYLQQQLSWLVLSQESPKKIEQFFFSSFYLTCTISGFACLILLLFSPEKLFFSSAILGSYSLKPLFTFYCFFYLLRLPLSFYANGLFALGYFNIKSKIEIAESFFFLFLVLLSFFFKKSYFFLLICQALNAFLFAFCGFVFLIKISRWSFPRFFIKIPPSMPWLCFFQNLFSVFLFSPLPFFVASSHSLSVGASFSATVKLANICHVVHLSILLPLQRLYTQADVKNSENLTKKFLLNSLLFTLLYYFFCFAILYIGKDLFENILKITLMNSSFIFFLWMLLYGLINTLSVALNGYGRIKKQTFFLGLGVILLFSMHFIFFSPCLETLLLFSLLSQIPLFISNLKETYEITQKKSTDHKAWSAW